AFRCCSLTCKRRSYFWEAFERPSLLLLQEATEHRAVSLVVAAVAGFRHENHLLRPLDLVDRGVDPLRRTRGIDEADAHQRGTLDPRRKIHRVEVAAGLQRLGRVL